MRCQCCTCMVGGRRKKILDKAHLRLPMVQDIGPRYSGVLLGMSNTAGVLAGVFGTAATGYILKNGSWDEVIAQSCVVHACGAGCLSNRGIPHFNPFVCER